MSLVSLCQLWCLRPCRSWPRSGLHVLKPPSWLVPSESYQAALPTGPTFPWPQDAWRGLKRRSEKDTQWAVAAPWAHCLEGGGCLCLTPFAPCATQGVEAPGSQHQPQRRPPPHLAQVPLRSARSAQPSPVAPNSAILFICTQGAPPLLDVQGFDPFTTFMSLSPLSSYT